MGTRMGSYEPITDLSELESGDQIAWFRTFRPYGKKGYYHHAIVEHVHRNDGTITVIHNTGKPISRITKDTLDPFNTPAVSSTSVSSCGKGPLFKVILATSVYGPKEVVDRANFRLNKFDEKYEWLHNNCEHFAIWVKTGKHVSFQSQYIPKLRSTLKKWNQTINGINEEYDAFRQDRKQMQLVDARVEVQYALLLAI